MADQAKVKVQGFKTILAESRQRILETFSSISVSLNKMTMSACENINRLDLFCDSLLADLCNTNGPQLFNRLISCTNQSLDAWKVPKLTINHQDFFQSLFSFSEVGEPFTWTSNYIELLCGHKEATILTTKCKNSHCIVCLKLALQSNEKNCPCGIELTISEREKVFNT